MGDKTRKPRSLAPTEKTIRNIKDLTTVLLQLLSLSKNGLRLAALEKRSLVLEGPR
jgi:hypothetical protein